jgi:hypothetical protein
MKKAIIILIILLPVTLNEAKGQETDRVRLGFELSTGILPMKLSGTHDVGNGATAIIGNQDMAEYPVYRHTDTNLWVFNVLAHLSINLPFYRNNSWSIGVKLSAGFGIEGGGTALGLKSYVFDFPQYIYYRNYKRKFDYSILLGYKYAYAALPYQLIIAGFEYNIDEFNSIRLYGSLNRYQYYQLYTNGRIEPMLKISEFGISYSINF